ncbi:hypothetical protein H0H92_015672 [Tricholoma furcatifolium]|nr:hypothetical protein H0H92_015672 [Tricholoma furcatifolium]
MNLGNALGEAIAAEDAASRDVVSHLRRLQQILPSSPDHTQARKKQPVPRNEDAISVLTASTRAEQLYMQARIARAEAEIAFFRGEMASSDFPDIQDRTQCEKYMMDAYQRELSNSVLALPRINYEPWR